MAEIRLQKVLAAAGIASRRACEEIITDGLVRVNRKVIDQLPAFVDPDKDVITVNGKRIRAEEKVYYLLNKSKGVICTNSDPQGRRRAIDIVKSKQRIFCVGRLDIDTTGLIILTNDSELTNKLTHPKFELAKTYIAQVKGMIDSAAVEKLKKGVWLAEGKTGRTAVKILKKSYKESAIEISVRRGMNRQIRRMLVKVGLKVRSLRRAKIGKINDRGVGVGKFRKLTKAEVTYLKKVTADGQSLPPKPKKSR